MESNSTQTSYPPEPTNKSFGPPVLDPDPIHEQEDAFAIHPLRPQPILDPEPSGTSPLGASTSSRYRR